MVKGADSNQAQALLKASSKPLVLLMSELPDPEVVALVKKKDAAIGLLLARETDTGEYFKQLDKAKEALGSKHLMIVNAVCLWHKPGKNQFLNLTSEVLKAKFERSDFQNIYSGAFFRILDTASTSN